MTNVNGLSAFELLSDLDDDLVAEAILPEDGAAAVPRTRGARIWECISDFMSNGRAAAILSAVISLTVLVAIIRAGQVRVKDEAEKPGNSGGTPSYGWNEAPAQSGAVMDGNMEVDAVEKEDVSKEASDEAQILENPYITVRSAVSSLYFADRSQGYMLWDEFWYGGGMVSGDGLGAEGRLSDIRDGLPHLTVSQGEALSVVLRDSCDTLSAVIVCDADGERVARGKDLSVLSELEGGEYVVILSVRTQGDYVPEADAYEASCYEYAFILHSMRPDIG